MSVQDILNIDNKIFNSLTESDLRKVVGRLVSAGNKRLRTFERNETKSPAVGQVMRSGGVFSTKGKDLAALRAEYSRAKSFLQAKTGTVKQWTKVKQETIASMKKRGVELSPNQFDAVFKIYDRLSELDPTIEDKRYKYKVIDEITNELADALEDEEGADQDILINDVASSMMDRITEIYEEEQEEDAGGVSEFFDL
jgi:hypothetical protein